MINYSYGDFETFVLDNDSRVYRMWQYKKSWTPWEEKNCTDFDSNLINDECDFVVIRESITLPDGDILLGVQHIYFDEDDNIDETPDKVSMYYYKLSEIVLAYVPSDQFGYREGDEE